jgi:hypothetical protein
MKSFAKGVLLMVMIVASMTAQLQKRLSVTISPVSLTHTHALQYTKFSQDLKSALEKWDMEGQESNQVLKTTKMNIAIVMVANNPRGDIRGDVAVIYDWMIDSDHRKQSATAYWMSCGAKEILPYVIWDIRNEMGIRQGPLPQPCSFPLKGTTPIKATKK